MKKLSIPERLTLRKEFFPGFGWPELRRWLIASLPFVAVTTVINVTCRDRNKLCLASILLCIVVMAALVAVFTRADETQSIYTFLARRIRFRRVQQKFYCKRKEVIFLDEETR